MGSSDELTFPEERAISEREAAVIDWVLASGALEGSLDHLRGSVRDLRVVARCTCGCASVDFVTDQARARPIAEAVARDSRGRACGVIVWGLEGRSTGLEIYEGEPDSATEIPTVESRRRWDSFVS